MYIESPREKLERAIYKASRLTNKSATVSVLKCVLLEAKDNTLLIRATNLDLGIEIQIPVKVIEEGSVAISGEILAQFLASVPQEKSVELKTEEGVLKVIASRSSASVKTELFEDFPLIPRISEGKEFTIDSNELFSGFKAVFYSAAVSGIRPELSCVYVYQDNQQLTFVSTDSFRLAEKKVKIKGDFQIDDLLIPSKNVADILRMFDGEGGVLKVVSDKSQISFQGESLYVVSRVVTGSFPDYKQIIPKEPKTEVTVLKQDFLSILKTAHVFSDSFNRVTFSINPAEKSFEIRTKNNDVGENKNSLTSTLTGEAVELSFNYKNIIDCFQSIPSDSLNLSFNGVGKALVIRPFNDQSFLYLAMPMSK